MSRRIPWQPASRRGPSASWSPMNNLWLSALTLLVLFILDGLLAMARAALVNSRGSKLQSMVEEQVPGAALAQRLASEATRFLLSLRIGLGGIRLLSVGLGLALYVGVLAFEEHSSLEEATDGLLGSGYSRAPVYRGSIDNVVGLVYVKDLLAAWREGGEDKAVGKLMREPYFVPEAKLVDDLLEEMQDRRVQMAIVVDEYGGTAGVVTIEDIVEEIIGEIRDE